jgi:hypothetical protein
MNAFLVSGGKYTVGRIYSRSTRGLRLNRPPRPSPEYQMTLGLHHSYPEKEPCCNVVLVILKRQRNAVSYYTALAPRSVITIQYRFSVDP